MATNPYDTPTFSATEYVAMYPDLQDWWNGVTPGSENVKSEWNNDRNAWALDHWLTHGQAEGRQGRSSVYVAASSVSVTTTGLANKPAPSAAAASTQNKNSTMLWLLIAAGVGIYLYSKMKSAEKA